MGKIYLELIKDWETPITTFRKGHFNDCQTWAKLLGITLQEFYSAMLSGQFEHWFKANFNPYA